MKTLVLGSTGMVGANVVSQLNEKGESPRLLARNPEKTRTVLSEQGLDSAGFEIMTGDITAPESLKVAMEGIELVYHCAGLPEQWFKDPDVFQRVNHQGTRNVMNAALESGVSRVVYTSTIDVFQGKTGERYDEDILDPAPKGTYYERSKQDADVAAVEALKQGLDVVFTHPAGLYGPGPAGSPGSNNFIADLINGRVPMLLPGGFPLVFSEDCAWAHIEAARSAPTGARYILSDDFYSLKDLALLVQRLVPDAKIPPTMPLWFAKLFSAAGELKAKITGKAPMLPAGQLHFLLWQAIPDAGRAKRELNWEVTPTLEGLEATIGHLKKKGLVK
ncbi:MAG: NAD-dependent dehydratase [Spirochaetaceae bacterium]|nr:NAD-dependent dehydratase [Spirochaetaceae bacterium]|tara:strand:+ start:76515 stop:77513 length:999 start_codon:yes stop_codon:yes gene_type:complete